MSGGDNVLSGTCKLKHARSFTWLSEVRYFAWQ